MTSLCLFAANPIGVDVKQRIGILHPGEMGISIAASAQNSGCEVYWASEGRRQQTRERAEQFGLRDSRTLASLCAECPIVISVCPPHAAESLANDVLAAGFTGVYVDANAIAPQRTIKIGQTMSAAGELRRWRHHRVPCLEARDNLSLSVRRARSRRRALFFCRSARCQNHGN